MKLKSDERKLMVARTIAGKILNTFSIIDYACMTDEEVAINYNMTLLCRKLKGEYIPKEWEDLADEIAERC